MSDKPTIVNKKAIFVNNFKNLDDPFSDLTVIKEKIKLSDGREVPHMRFEENVERPFWIEKRMNQVYRDKKETRSLAQVDEIWCTQAKLRYQVAKATGQDNGSFIPGLRALAQNPYLYGLDCDVTVQVKRGLDKKYTEQYGEYNPQLSMAVLDYETNVDSHDEEIIMGSVTMKDTWLCVVDANWLASRSGCTVEQLDDVIHKYLGDIAKERGVKDLSKCVVLANSEIDICRLLFQKLHELKPDVCSIWNMSFDINKTLEACARAGVDPQELFVDPDVPEEYRDFFWKEDLQNKAKADGTSSTKDPADKWHWVTAAASFNFIDNMCAFRMFRAMEQKMASYSLDAVLQRVFGGKLRKMKFKEASHLPENSLEWHKFMQRKFPLEYIAYNIFDCVVMELLDEEQKDISHKLLPYVGISHWAKAKSNPTRLADAYHFFLHEKHGRVLCSTSNKMKHKFDDLTLPKTGWIVTLDNTRISQEAGYNPFTKETGKGKNNEYGIATKAYRLVFDIDVSSAYPSNELALNVSRDTTLVEVCAIDGLTLEEHREVCLDLTNARGNASKICQKVLKFPSSDELYDEFMKEAA